MTLLFSKGLIMPPFLLSPAACETMRYRWVKAICQKGNKQTLVLKRKSGLNNVLTFKKKKRQKRFSRKPKSIYTFLHNCGWSDKLLQR